VGRHAAGRDAAATVAAAKPAPAACNIPFPSSNSVATTATTAASTAAPSIAPYLSTAKKPGDASVVSAVPASAA